MKNAWFNFKQRPAIRADRKLSSAWRMQTAVKI